MPRTETAAKLTKKKSKKYTPDIHSSRFREGAALHQFLIFTHVESKINGLISARQSNEIELTKKNLTIELNRTFDYRTLDFLR